MTEAEWLAADDLLPMLEYLRGKASDEKLRLFACAICRRHERQVPVPGFGAALEVVERYADGLIPAEERTNYLRITTAFRTVARKGDRVAKHAASVMYYLCNSTEPGYLAATVAIQGFQSKKSSVRQGRTRLLRDIIVNPFRPVTIHPAWLTSTVVGLAETIYADRAYDRLPILADALQDAGCESEDVLTHCRSDGPHVRGCWVVDLLLGKK